MRTEIVIGRALGPDGRIAGTYNDNPIMNFIVYEVEVPDGHVKEYTANLIAENMMTQVDSEGYSISTMDGIIAYQKDEATAISETNRFVVTAQGRRRYRKTTIIWKLLVKWKDESET